MQRTLEKFAASVDVLLESHQECADALHQSQLAVGREGQVGEKLRKIALEMRERAPPYVTLLPAVMRVYLAISKVATNTPDLPPESRSL